MAIQQIVDKKMPSITEWMEQINLSDIENFRQEDNNKRDRLEILYQTTGLQYDRPEKLLARDISDRNEKFQEILTRRGDEKCALRLVPLKPHLPKLRVRGKTLRENILWFDQQNINIDEYKAEIIAHCDDTTYSAILMIDEDGIFGEIIPGPHWQLTQGIYEDESKILTFKSDFKNWEFSYRDRDMEQVVKEATSRILIKDPEKQKNMTDKLGSKFTSDGHLIGYFEFVVWPEIGISFVDYNRIIHKIPKTITSRQKDNDTNALKGICASSGQATGKVRIINDPKNGNFEDGDILVCSMTMVEHIPLMKKCAGIITDLGNILSHAAIVSRELKKPCLVGAKNATQILKDGDIIFLDADRWVVEIKNTK